MGIDGFSLRNLGLGQDKMSSHLSTEAEFLAAREFSEDGAIIDAAIGQQKIGRKEDDYGEDKSNQSFSGGDTTTSAEKLADDIQEEISDADEEDEDDEDNRRYIVTQNEITEDFELRDTEKEILLDRLSINELQYITDRLDRPAGLIVNKKV